MTANAAPATIIAILGTSPRAVRYRLDGQEMRATVSAAALAHLLPAPVGRIVAACTPHAGATAAALEAERPSHVRVQRLPVEASLSKPEAVRFVEGLIRQMVSDGPVIVDITNGPRHLAVLGFAAAALAASVGKTRIDGVYYAWVDPGPPFSGGTRPASDPGAGTPSGEYVDLADLVTVFDLVHAARSFTETGSADALTKVLSARGPLRQRDQEIVRCLRSFSHATQAGLPLEQGRAAAQIRDLPLERTLRARNLPMAADLAKMVDSAVLDVALDVSVSRAPGEGWKRVVRLDAVELDRQRRSIDTWIRRGAWNTALLAMEEWVVSWAIHGIGEGERWLEKETRRRANARLHALRVIRQAKETLRARLTQDQERLANFWDALSEARNAFAHAGMRKEPLEPERGRLKELLGRIVDSWKWLAVVDGVPLDVDATMLEPLLISPLGRQPGALYTALKKHPSVHRCLVVCSEETRPRLSEVAAAVGREMDWKPLVLRDPLAGVEEIQSLLDQADGLLLDAPELLVHVTGGSSLMYYLCSRIGERARSLGRPVRSFLTLDRRTRPEQDLDPYQEGELVYLDDRTEISP